MSDTTPISWTCEKCGFPIADGAGSVNIPFAELSAHGKGDRLTWRVQHDRCLPDTAVYGVDVDYIRDKAGIRRWTEHLMGKNWFADTNWGHVISTALHRESAGA